MSSLPIQPTDNSNAGLASACLGLIGLMYIMYEYFDRKISDLRDHQDETNTRFNTTERKLAVLVELEDDVRDLKDQMEENKSSWEDDVVEPGKYQAIVGKGTVNETEVEFRFIREKLDTFKSNRYWLLNDIVTNVSMIEYSIMKFENVDFTTNEENTKKTAQLEPILLGLDTLLHQECIITGDISRPFSEIFEVAKRMDKTFTWKRAIIKSVSTD